MAKKSAPKKKDKKAKVKPKAKPKAAVKKAAPKKSKPVAKAKAKPAAKAKAKPAAKKAKPVAKAKPAAKKVKPAAKAKPAPKKVAGPAFGGKITGRLDDKPKRRRRRKPDVPPPRKKTPEELQQEEAATMARINTTPLVQFRQREQVAKRPSYEKVLPEEANRARYSDKELEEFRKIINKKLTQARFELNTLTQQMLNSNEHGTDDTAGALKMLEDGGENLAKEEAGQLAIRQQKFIEQLEAALGRIENKTYGICVITGKLIPKERLRAVPHTTKSIEAKLNQYRD